MSVSNLASFAQAIASATTVRTTRLPLKEEPSSTIRSKITCICHRLLVRLGPYLTGFQIGIVQVNTPKASMRINQSLKIVCQLHRLQILHLTLSSPNWKSFSRTHLTSFNSSCKMPHNKLYRTASLRIRSTRISPRYSLVWDYQQASKMSTISKCFLKDSAILAKRKKIRLRKEMVSLHKIASVI